MDDLLAREDRFIERTALILGVAVPSSPIDYVWDPLMDGSEPWACPQTADCYQSREEDNISVVVSRNVTNHHELVHAVDIKGIGSNGHPTLKEGLAEYLGSLRSTQPREDFSEAFKMMVAASPKPSKYNLAMHFVGSIFERHGATKYRILRAKMPENADLPAFSRVFEAVYEQSLDEALKQMNGTRVYGVDQFPACGDGEALEIPWTSDGLIDTVIVSACGDPWFYGGGVVTGQAGFYGSYTIEILEDGYYDLTVSGGSLLGLVTGCSFATVQSAVGSFGGKTGQGLLQSGRHTLTIAFPAQKVARGEASVRVEYVGPSP